MAKQDAPGITGVNVSTPSSEGVSGISRISIAHIAACHTNLCVISTSLTPVTRMYSKAREDIRMTRQGCCYSAGMLVHY
jgi:hypothetical protein